MSDTLFNEVRTIVLPYEDLEEAVIQYLEARGFIADNEVVLQVDLGNEVDANGMVEMDLTITWLDGVNE